MKPMSLMTLATAVSVSLSRMGEADHLAKYVVEYGARKEQELDRASSTGVRARWQRVPAELARQELAQFFSSMTYDSARLNTDVVVIESFNHADMKLCIAKTIFKDPRIIYAGHLTFLAELWAVYCAHVSERAAQSEATATENKTRFLEIMLAE